MLSQPRRLMSCIAFVCAFWCGTASALGTDGTIADLRRTSWGSKEGAPSGVTAMAQTIDGYLWLGTSSGLFRFDGLRFERLELPRDDRLSSLSIQSLFAPASGGLWIGFTFGGAAFLKDRKLTAYSERDGLRPGSVRTFAVDHRGKLWVGTTSGLTAFDGSRWQKIGAEHGYAETQTLALMVDSAGTLWSMSRNKILFLPSGEERFLEIDGLRGNNDSAGIAESPDGEVWVANDDRLHRLRKNDNPGRQTNASELLLRFDRTGNLWSVDWGGAVRRIAHRERLAHAGSWAEANAFSTTDDTGAPKPGAGTKLMEDREGNLWVSSTTALIRFSERRVIRPLQREAVDFHAAYASLAPGDGATTWVAGRDFPTFRLGDRKTVRHDELGPVSCVTRGGDDSLWFGSKGILWKLSSGRLDRFPMPAGTEDFEVQAMAVDKAGDLWISVVRNGVFLLSAGGWKPYGDIKSLPRLTAVSLATDAAGRIWFGYTEGRVAVLDGSELRVFSEGTRLPVGNVTALYGKRSRQWVGGELGLALLDGAGFRAVTFDAGTPLGSVTGIIETADGDLWVNSRVGIVHFTAAETRRMTEDASYSARGETFDARDGVEGSSARLRPLPTAIEGADGRLWFLTDADLYAIDPAHIRRNALPPPVVIESLIVGDRSYAATPNLTLAKGTTSVRINYVGLSLTMAEKVRYRIKLDSVDRDWQDAQGRHEALYTDLGPGTHRFHVTAANNDGVWNDTGATIDFVVPPTFFQTGWFIALCVASTVLFVWLATRFRVRQVAARLRVRFAERMAERERIARELHDTLLQSTQGLILRFQAVANQIDKGHPTRDLLDDALHRADAVMAEGRDRVLDLRVSADPQGELQEAFAATGVELAQGRAVTFRCVTDGAPRELRQFTRDETYLIGREALLNAFRHAQAASIEVQLVYSEEDLRVRVRDDGVGVDEQTLAVGSRPDHWGMQSMRERAHRMGAMLDLWSRPGVGTEIELRIPAAVAYPVPVLRSRWWMLWRLAGGGP